MVRDWRQSGKHGVGEDTSEPSVAAAAADVAAVPLQWKQEPHLWHVDQASAGRSKLSCQRLQNESETKAFVSAKTNSANYQ